MDVFMIGNGFDLHYCLPTTYTCFLRTVESISERLAKGERITSVAQVFGDSDLYNSDRALKRCYDTYSADYNAELDPDQIGELFGRAEQNLWFSYLLHSFDPGKGWIDFEQEIRQVIQTISIAVNSFYREGEIYIHVDDEDSKTAHILAQFPFFYDENLIDGIYDSRTVTFYPVLQKYLLEEPIGSGEVHIDKTQIASDLYNELRTMAGMLSAYLRLFVDKPVENLAKHGKVKLDDLLQLQDWSESQIVSFNYTHTMQRLYHNGRALQTIIHYIHGELTDGNEAGIVLGFDADELDELGNVDVTFVQFKKYFQRVFYRTDLSYISFLDMMDRRKQTFDYITLRVIGHSLDFTDREIIRDCFLGAGRIIIYFHNNTALTDYIRNLVKIFGKREFDRLRTQKNLVFLPITDLDKKS